MLTRRTRTPERMDDPDVDRGELERSLAFIRVVNRRLGGTRAALGHLERWTAARQAVRVIDLGTGSADIPLAMVRWGAHRGREVHVTGIDAHPVTLALAREHVGASGAIELVEADCLRLMDRYEPASFDYAHAGMFLHHLDDIEVLTVLRIMDRLARRGVIWNDLVRGPIEKLAVRALVVGQSPIVRHDARASVAAGFTKREALDLAERAGWASPVFRRHLFGRFTVTSEKNLTRRGFPAGRAGTPAGR